jgi:ribosomal protein S27AE
MADGRVNKCKECTKADVSANRAAKAEYYREYDKKRFKDDPRVKARHKRYLATEAGKESMKKARIKYKLSYPKKYMAHNLVNNSVRDGKIIRRDCEICGSGSVHAHHDDYARPLEVRWLCAAHHKQWHTKNGEGINAS